MELNEKLKNECELTDQQKEEVIAGAGEEKRGVETVMRCDSCGWEQAWAGDYMNGQFYDCPICKEHSYHGIRYR